mmetsp:Transcript_4104/g.10380  ORF Transcript_4104/g.10380 Transcript_4104/m.10380 type:complete len:487 (-) Transcript_4104:358-1818(-)
MREPPTISVYFRPVPGFSRQYLSDGNDSCLRARGLTRATVGVVQVTQHYSRALLPGLFRLLGSVGIFGQPLRNLNYVGLGLAQFLAGPAMGLAQSVQGQGPRRFAEGVADGTGALLRGTLFALTNATSKWSASARKGLAAMGWTPRAAPQRERSGSGRGWEEPDAEGDGGGGGDGGAKPVSLLSAVMRGLAGVVAEPVRGMDQRGLSGLLGGIFTGVTGAVGHPAAGILQISERISASLQHLVAGSPAQLGRVRLPRHVPRGGVLRPYRRLEAVGHALLPAAVGSTTARHQAEEVLLCCVEVVGAQQAAGEASRGAGDEFAVLTPQRISQLHVPAGSAIAASAAVLVWAIQLQDILLVSKQGCQLELLSLTGPEQRRGHSDPTALVLGRQPALTSPQPAGSKHSPDAGRPHSPVRHTCIACRTEEAAAELEAQLDTLLRDARGDAGSPTVARDAPPLADRRSLSGLPSSSDISRTAELAGRAAREV